MKQIIAIFQWCRKRFCVLSHHLMSQSHQYSKELQLSKHVTSKSALEEKLLSVIHNHENRLSTMLFDRNDLVKQEAKDTPTVILGHWSEWSSYSKCEKNCKMLGKRTNLFKEQLTYSKFKGLKVSSRYCKIPSPLNDLLNSREDHAKCIGPTHRYQECHNLKVSRMLKIKFAIVILI